MPALRPTVRAAVRDLALGKGNFDSIATAYGIPRRSLGDAWRCTEGRAIRRQVDVDVVDAYVRCLIALEYRFQR